jgi:hypothetical protein
MVSAVAVVVVQAHSVLMRYLMEILKVVMVERVLLQL